jgi:hypothetical protein
MDKVELSGHPYTSDRYKQLPENLSRKGFVPIRGFPHSVT